MATPNGFSSVINACPALPARLKDAWETGVIPQDNIPGIEYLASPQNKRPITQMILPPAGNIRTVRTFYTRRLLEENVKTNQPNPNCTTTDKYGDNYKDYTFDPADNYQQQDTIGVGDYDLACADPSVIAQRVINMADVLDRRVGTDMSTALVALNGKWSADVPHAASKTDGSVTNSSEELYTAAFTTGKLNAIAVARIQNALMDTGFGSDYFMVGGRTLREMVQLYQAGCCTTDGIDLGEIFAQYGFASAYDKRIAAALASQDKYLVLSQGAVQLLSWNRGIAAPVYGAIVAGGIGSNYVTTLIPSPRYAGVAYELNVADNCGTISLSMTATVALIGMPDDMYVEPVASGSGATAGDPMYGVTGVVKGILA